MHHAHRAVLPSRSLAATYGSVGLRFTHEVLPLPHALSITISPALLREEHEILLMNKTREPIEL